MKTLKTKKLYADEYMYKSLELRLRQVLPRFRPIYDTNSYYLLDLENQKEFKSKDEFEYIYLELLKYQKEVKRLLRNTENSIKRYIKPLNIYSLDLNTQREILELKNCFVGLAYSRDVLRNNDLVNLFTNKLNVLQNKYKFKNIFEYEYYFKQRYDFNIEFHNIENKTSYNTLKDSGKMKLILKNMSLKQVDISKMSTKEFNDYLMKGLRRLSLTLLNDIKDILKS